MTDIFFVPTGVTRPAQPASVCQGPAQLIALSSAELIADVGLDDLDLTGFARIESQLG